MNDLEKPIIVSPGWIQGQLAVLFRQGGLVVGAGATLLTMMQAGDLNGIRDYMLGNDFLIALTATWAIGSLLYGQFKAYRDKKLKIVLAKVAPDHVAQVKTSAEAKAEGLK